MEAHLRLPEGLWSQVGDSRVLLRGGRGRQLVAAAAPGAAGGVVAVAVAAAAVARFGAGRGFVEDAVGRLRGAVLDGVGSGAAPAVHLFFEVASAGQGGGIFVGERNGISHELRPPEVVATGFVRKAKLDIVSLS